MLIGIYGAAGAVGRVLAPELARRRHTVRLVGRSEEPLRRLQATVPGAEVLAADIAEAAQARLAASGLDAVVYAVGVPYHQFELHPQLMRTALGGALGAGVRRFVHISNVYVYGLPQGTPVNETHPLQPHTVKGRYRLEQEDLVRAAHSTAMRTTILRPPGFYGPNVELSFAHGIITAALAGKAAPVLAPVDIPQEHVYVPDLAPVLARMLESETVWGEAFNIAGAGSITMREFADAIFAAAGTKRKLQVATPLMVRFLGLFSPFMRELVEMDYLQSNPVLLDDAKLRAAIGPIEKTPYSVGTRLSVEAARTPVAA